MQPLDNGFSKFLGFKPTKYKKCTVKKIKIYIEPLKKIRHLAYAIHLRSALDVNILTYLAPKYLRNSSFSSDEICGGKWRTMIVADAIIFT